MATGIDIWIAKPGSACSVDDGDWVVTIEDAHGAPYAWAGDSYASLPAPIAHWAGAIPPGTYVVHGRRTDGSRVTDRAIVAIDPGEVLGVRLWVAGDHDRPGRPDRPERACEIEIDSVRAHGKQHVASVEIEGSATGCAQVEVAITHRGKTIKAKASVKGGGWSVKTDIRSFEARCGDPAEITARCREDRSCSTTQTVQLDCVD